MSEPRLKTRLWVQANVRKCDVDGLCATVARRGDDDAGTVLLKINRLDGGFTVLAQARTVDGEPAWIRGTGPEPVDEAAADSYIARQVGRDGDLWVVEIEDREGRMPFGGVIL
ncbi:MAG: DUF1491 family protein, partial [Alphaproteobacteria bacterium]|nr:DUF1491 family protein [Alphaproteobacteria bacterium]